LASTRIGLVTFQRRAKVLAARTDTTARGDMAWPSIQRDFMYPRSLSKRQARRQDRETWMRNACQSRCFVAAGRRETGRERRAAEPRSGGLMTKATGWKQCTPRHFCTLFCSLGRAVNRRGARGDFWSGMCASHSPFERSDTAGYKCSRLRSQRIEERERERGKAPRGANDRVYRERGR